ncbi:protein SEC13 homolog isoform X2 [Uloborus diversus]|nr:protein SEC13 homolog isoform X2 [Uloborus diversus]
MLMHDVDAGHSDMIHDAQMDYCGAKLATCSSDKTIKVFDVINGAYKPLATLRGHEGPVWQVSWAHPSFGTILASCSYDKKVIIWSGSDTSWKSIHVYEDHESSVNSLSWAPLNYGLMLACGSSDGCISVLTGSGNQWTAKKIINAHTIGCNAVSWAPFNAELGYASSADDTELFAKRFVTGGCDNLVKIWKYVEKQETWVEEDRLEAHSNWVRDVVWAPSAIFEQSVIASCSQDKRVIIWTKKKGSNWTPKALPAFEDVVWHVSFSATGGMLAVSGGDNEVSLWKAVNSTTWVRLDDVKKSKEEKKS